jgi:hypothetical protein
MDLRNDLHELQRQIEEAKGLASVTTDRTTYHQLTGFAEDLKNRLRQLSCAAI